MIDQEYWVALVLTDAPRGETASDIALLAHGWAPAARPARRRTMATVYRMHRAGKLRVVGITATGGRPARLYALPTVDVTG